MKTTGINNAPLSGLHVDVASMVTGAREIGPVILVDDSRTPQGIVLAFEHPQQAAKEMLARGPSQFADPSSKVWTRLSLFL